MARWAAVFALIAGLCGLYAWSGTAGVAVGIAQTCAALLAAFAVFLAALHLTRRVARRS